MLEKRAFDLERTDAITRRKNDVVRPPDEPEIAVFVGIAGDWEDPQCSLRVKNAFK
jgi:hypothetical protein